MLALLPLLYLFLIWTKGAGASDPSLPFMEYLDNDNLVCLKWGFNDVQGNITFKLVVNTTGWVGFGFSPNGGMAGSDIVIGGLGPSGIYFTDYHATGNSKPVVDSLQSYTLLSLNESEEQTSMSFSRSIQTCDDQDFHITARPITLIYAYGTTDVIAYHAARRGTKDVNLLDYMPRSTLTNTSYLTIRMDNITLPPVHTFYYCKVMNFPMLYEKHHIYQIEPVIENPDIVHHMLLYKCPSFVTESSSERCYIGDDGDYCLGVVATWAVGGGVFELPENVGIPVGGGDRDTFYRLEIHYNNPAYVPGRIDSSGLRLHYTAQLRQHDAGTLTTGVMPFVHIDYEIPPQATQFHTYGVCNTSLFYPIMNPVPDLQVFAVMLHTHLAGRKVRVGHFRNGSQIDFLGLDENYNFELQQAVTLGNIKTIKPGDEIVVECTYSTVNRTGVTQMGFATTDEMCLAFLLFYPANNITTCVSYPDTTNVSVKTNYGVSKGTKVSNQDEIAEYESLLYNLPQIQEIFGDALEYHQNPKGMIREMMKTPVVTCEIGNMSNKLGASWILNQAGIIFSLLWIALL